MTKKAGVVIGAILAAAAVIGFVACVFIAGGKSENYRSIMVYQVNGSATITRERVGEMEAYENLMLQSGDIVAVGPGSSMRLKLDDDKYVLAEQDTLMSIVADGDHENARTYIDLQRGSVTSEIQNKLTDGSTYEVNTPNSIMAVRGTIFRVGVELDENGNSNTKVTVFKGAVSAKTIMPDGAVSEEEIRVEAGKELTVQGTSTTSEYVGEPTDIDYDSLPDIIKEYIEEMPQSGTEQAETDETEQREPVWQTPSVKSEEPSSNPLEGTTPQRDSSESEQRDAQKTGQQEIKQREPQSEQRQETGQQKAEPQSPPQDIPQAEPSSPPQEDEDAGDTKPQYCTVTFQYKGYTFGTQKVKKGETATEPKLIPTENGAWDYDFSEKVEENLIIRWTEK